MAETYQLSGSKMLKLKKQYSPKYLFREMLVFSKKLLGIGLALAGTGIITWAIYQNCVTPSVLADGTYQFSMGERITTGSLFATFGSAIIAVFTLYTSRYFSNFHSALGILMLELAPEDSEGVVKQRWAFMPRVSRTRFSGEEQFFGVESVKIQFAIDRVWMEFPLPTTETDFKDLPLLSSYLQMKRMRKRYLTYLQNETLLDEYPAWDCVMAIYRNILFYKACYFCVWIGVYFVLQSILFTFFYGEFYCLVGGLG